MTKIFIEAKDKRTSEYHFLTAILNLYFTDKEVNFVFMNGIGNLFKEAIVNQIRLAQESGEQVIVLADADTVAKGYGYVKRKEEIGNGMAMHGLNFPYFLYPNNGNDGDVEELMEKTARRDLHATFFDCFEDYERCVSAAKNTLGEPKYHVPNLKSKLHTYIAAQRLSRKLSNKIGSGDWMFDNTDYWDLNVYALQPLKDFFAANLK